MAFQADIAFTLELMALALGSFLLITISKEKELCCHKFLKIISYIIIVGSFLTMACTIINSFKEAKSPRQSDRRMQFTPRNRSRGEEENRSRPGGKRERDMMQRDKSTQEDSPLPEPGQNNEDEIFPPANEGNP